MRVGPRQAPVLLNSYNLTGDLVSFDRCALQYRLFTRTGVRQSHQVASGTATSCTSECARPTGVANAAVQSLHLVWPVAGDYGGAGQARWWRLRAEGLFRPSSMGVQAERRLLRAIHVLGPLIFPLIKEARYGSRRSVKPWPATARTKSSTR